MNLRGERAFLILEEGIYLCHNLPFKDVAHIVQRERGQLANFRILLVHLLQDILSRLEHLESFLGLIMAEQL